MSTARNVDYRLALATGFLNEAEQDFTLGRWRSCVDNAQLLTDYGDEASFTLPWDLFTQQTAEDALQAARRSLQSANALQNLVAAWRKEQSG